MNLFDLNGQRIPPEGLRAKICSPDDSFYLTQPGIDYAAVLDRLHKYLCQTGITAEQFQTEAERIKTENLTNEQISNLFKGVHLPVVIPQNIRGVKDIGTILNRWMIAVCQSYETEFPSRKFWYPQEKKLINKVQIVSESRQQELLKRMSNQPVIGWYFPCSLRSYSVLAQREQMNSLPENLILSGLDAVIAEIMYPAVLARDSNTFPNDLSAFSWGANGYSLFFRANYGSLRLLFYGHLGYPHNASSGGLLLIGSRG